MSHYVNIREGPIMPKTDDSVSDGFSNLYSSLQVQEPVSGQDSLF